MQNYLYTEITFAWQYNQNKFRLVMVYYLVKNYWYYNRAYTILVNDGMIQNFVGHSLYSRFFIFQYHYEDISMVTEFRFKKGLACNMTLCFCASKLHSMGVGPSSARYFVHDFIPYKSSVICLYLCMIWNRQSVWILTFLNRFG